jgi:putative restriction endonuclease
LEAAEDFDRQAFKLLPKNDTGEAKGHQAGFLVPQDLAKYFPQLPPTTAQRPAVYRAIRVALLVGSQSFGMATPRYQHQTWGGRRPAERRVTGDMAHWQAEASKDDLLLIERSLTDELFYRLTLHKKGSAAYVALMPYIGKRRWGALNPGDPPISQGDIERAEAEQEKHEADPLDLFDNAAAVTESRVRKIARSRVFQRRISKAYDGRCAVCGGGLLAADGRSEVEAAHIVPRGLKGADDVRNGLALCRTHHWAFDRGIFGVDPAGKIFVASKAAARTENAGLVAFAGKLLLAPKPASSMPSPQAFEWHMKEIVLKAV